VAEIEKQFTRLDAAVAALKRVKANLKRYRAAVLKAACEGRLVPTEAELARAEGRDYEPSDHLLARILQERRFRWEADQLAKMKASGKSPKDDKWIDKYADTASLEASNLLQLPEGWVRVRSDSLFTFVTSGSRGWAKYYSSSGALFLRMGNLNHCSITLDLSDLQRVRPPTSVEGTRTRVQPGDILISITADVGMVALAPGDLAEAYVNQHVALARPVSTISSAYLAWYLASESAQRQFIDLQRGATKLGLGLDDIRAVNIPLPPMAEQNRIIAEVERHFSVIDELEMQVEGNLKRAERLRQAILKRAFEGKLVPQDPSDEPASVLLERIRTERAQRKSENGKRTTRRVRDKSLTGVL
jgi:type I restriction enzyme S subunit